MRSFLSKLLLAVLFCWPVITSADSPSIGHFDLGGNLELVNEDFEDWSGIYFRTVFKQSNKTVWNAEVANQQAFGDSGFYSSIGLTKTLASDWYAFFSVGAGSGDFFYPQFRTDVFINRKCLPQKNLVLTAGFGYIAAQDDHRDYSVFLGTTYRLGPRWILEGGVRFNRSTPGPVDAPSGFIAVTYGQEKKQYLIVRAGYGREAYQLIGPTQALVDFRSQSVSLTWRKWWGETWGTHLMPEYYLNPSYHRMGASVAFFKEF